MLDLIQYITKRCKHITSGEVVIYGDNKINIRHIHNKESRESDTTQEVEATIAAIKEEIDNASIDITIEYSNNKPRYGKTF